MKDRVSGGRGHEYLMLKQQCRYSILHQMSCLKKQKVHNWTLLYLPKLMITYCDFNFSEEHTIVNFEWEYNISFEKNAFENDMCKIVAILSMFECENLHWNRRKCCHFDKIFLIGCTERCHFYMVQPLKKISPTWDFHFIVITWHDICLFHTKT